MAFFDFMFALPPLAALSLVTLAIALLVTLVTKFTTDQKRMKELREDQKRFQKEMKDLRDDPEKMMKVQKKAMGSNLEYMKHSFRSTLYTFLPMILIFSWLNASFAYYNVMPGEQFNITVHFADGTKGNVSIDPTPQLILGSPAVQAANASVSWSVHATAAGEHLATVRYGEESYTQKVLVSTDRTYLPPVQKIDHSKIIDITTDLKKVHPFGSFSIPWFTGPWYPGWFATYIFLSILFTTVLRKVLTVY